MEASEEFKKDACNRLTIQIRDEIEKDLHRTKTSARIETKEGQGEMRNVLLAVAYCLPEIGYCQGMNFLAGFSLIMSGGNPAVDKTTAIGQFAGTFRKGLVISGEGVLSSICDTNISTNKMSCSGDTKHMRLGKNQTKHTTFSATRDC